MKTVLMLADQMVGPSFASHHPKVDSMVTFDCYMETMSLSLVLFLGIAWHHEFSCIDLDWEFRHGFIENAVLQLSLHILFI